MPRAYLTRRMTFSAAHRYGNPGWTDEENSNAFGPWGKDGSHEHDYVCDLTVAGEIHPVTGFILDLERLDGILSDEVTRRFDDRDINADVPEFGDGGLAPSGENLARFIFDKIRDRLPETVDIVRVTIAENETLSSTYEGEG